MEAAFGILKTLLTNIITIYLLDKVLVILNIEKDQQILKSFWSFDFVFQCSVTCLVREVPGHSGQQRLENTLKQYGILASIATPTEEQTTLAKLFQRNVHVVQGMKKHPFCLWSIRPIFIMNKTELFVFVIHLYKNSCHFIGRYRRGCPGEPWDERWRL